MDTKTETTQLTVEDLLRMVEDVEIDTRQRIEDAHFFRHKEMIRFHKLAQENDLLDRNGVAPWQFGYQKQS